MSASLAHELSEKPHTPEDLALLAEVVKKCQRDRLAGKSSPCLPNTATMPRQHCLRVHCICRQPWSLESLPAGQYESLHGAQTSHGKRCPCVQADLLPALRYVCLLQAAHPEQQRADPAQNSWPASLGA